MEFKRVSSITLSCKTFEETRYVDKSKYKKILYSFMKRMFYYMVKDGVKIKLPMRLGGLQILKYKVKNTKVYNKLVDYKKTKELKVKGINKIVRHRQKATGGYWWRLHWFKREAVFKNKAKFSVEFSRPNRRPNTYNKQNPKLSVVPYFREKGWEIYRERDI